MNCFQCGTTLPESSTFCLKCGASIRQNTFSYLPAGAPPWPTNTADLPSLALGKRKPEIEAPTIVQEPKPQRSARNILAIVAFLLLAPIVGVGITLGSLWANGQFPAAASRAATHVNIRLSPTPATSSATPAATGQTDQLPTPSSFLTATSPQIGISLQYPSDWTEDAPTVTSSGNTFMDFHPQQLPTGISIGRLSASNSAKVSSTTDVNQANLLGFGSANNLGTPQMLTNTPTQATIGGATWDEQDATYTDTSGSGLVLHVTSISVKHNSIYYNILFYAPDTVYAEAMQKYYTQMLNSFKFTS